MPSNSIEIALELPCHATEVEIITIKIFGPGMFARAAFVLREGVAAEPHLSFVALKGRRVIGTVRQTRIRIGDRTALLLGPLGVLPEYKNDGHGRALMHASLEAARANNPCNAGLVLLVGDMSYYRQFGFKQVSADEVEMPRPVEPGRVLAFELQDGAIRETRGKAARWF